MAALWKENTGLGFVFAMWMALDSTQVAIPGFAAARDEGVAKREEIVSEYVRKIEMPASEIREYLTRNIVFEIDEELRKGMQLYFELAHTHGQIGELKRLEFIKSVNEATHDFG
jgi:chorismate dehydratase